ncbi:MAG TPA: response regulator [Terriglobia bacterium]|nr:response regulator [Terriglobia bacterium]
MTRDHPRRKVLIIEDEPSIRNIIYVLLARADCDGEIAYSGKQALGMIPRSSFDAVLLDIRSAEAPPEAMVAQMKKLRPSLVGRVLVITGETADPRILDWIDHHSLQHLPGNRLMQDLWDRLRVILGLAPSPNEASEEQ